MKPNKRHRETSPITANLALGFPISFHAKTDLYNPFSAIGAYAYVIDQNQTAQNAVNA